MSQLWDVADLYNVYRQGFTEDDSGKTNPGMLSEAEFNALPEAERFKRATGSIQNATNVFVDGDSVVGYGDPTFINTGEGWFDPTKVERGPDGKFKIPLSAVNEEALSAIQEQTDTSGFFSGKTPLENIARGALLVFGTAAAANALGLAGEGGLFGASTAADAAATAPEALGGTGGVTQYGTSSGLLNTVPEAAGAAGGASSSTAGIVNNSLANYGGMTGTLDGGIVNSVAPVGSAAGGVGGGAIPGAVAGAGANPAFSIPGWETLSAGTQRMIMQGVSTGAQALLASRAQDRQIAAADRRAQEERDFITAERRRRGQLTDYTMGGTRQIATSRPLPGGLVASRMGGGG